MWQGKGRKGGLGKEGEERVWVRRGECVEKKVEKKSVWKGKGRKSGVREEGKEN